MFTVNKNSITFLFKLNDNAVQVYALNDSTYGCYIGPSVYIHGIHDSLVAQYTTFISREEYFRFIAMVLRVALISMSTMAEGKYFLDPVVVMNVKSRVSLPDTHYEWTELVGDRGIRSYTDYELCNYFINRPDNLSCVSAIFAGALSLYALEIINVVFSDLHSPNSDISYLYSAIQELKSLRRK